MPLTLFQSSNQETALVTLSDELGNEINIPKWNCCSWAEKVAIEAELDRKCSPMEQQKNIVCAFLRKRFHQQIPSDITDDEILSIEGQPISSPMVELIYEFAMDEYNRSRPTDQVMTLIGKDAKEVAIDYAKTHQYCVITRKDFEKQGVYYVFRNNQVTERLTDKFFIVADYCTESEATEPKEPKTGKSRARS
jgi:hypothetical protein